MSCLLAGLGALGAAQAAELYRWVESDGSITFSPTPPDGDIDYEQVEAPGASDDAPSGLSSAQVSAPQQVDEPLEDSSSVSIDALSEPDPVSVDVDGLSYAPPPMGAAVDGHEGIRPGDAVPAEDATASAEPDAHTATASADPASVRRERCRELAKRVVSLERRLGTKLSPEDMDNTVLYMARYQASVDQHCRS